MKPPGVPVFIVLGVVLWVALTVGVLITVAQAPGEHLDLVLALGVCWIILIALAAMSRITERLGGGHR